MSFGSNGRWRAEILHQRSLFGATATFVDLEFCNAMTLLKREALDEMVESFMGLTFQSLHDRGLQAPHKRKLREGFIGCANGADDIG